ncbi:MAG TPA: heavy-metal-associated domain-containing protein [Allosphingosinicella sp.]|uniref:heavy-metal-associated domain-containing protein n=1 Tax=Allosphingosinicella sp. TaxID=2823234 RepID=UPI002ED90BAE
MKLLRRPLPLISLGLALVLGGGALYAQLEGADRGIPPVESETTYEVNGIEVDVVGPDAEAARLAGWRQAQQKGWAALWAGMNKRPQAQAPKLADSVLNQMVSSIVIEQEQIGPRRYIARLGLLFDRSRSAQALGVATGPVSRSQPMLVIPVMLTGSSFQSFESRNAWQAAWARFRTGNSAIDYIRPVGNGVDPLLLNAAQTRRPGRGWWRMILDFYGASDVIVPEVRLKRSYPGGPAIGTFTAWHGPDRQIIARFSLRAGNSASIPAMLSEGVRRMDIAYQRAQAAGFLASDRSLVVQEPAILARLAELIEQRNAPEQNADPSATVREPSTAPTAPIQAGGAQSFNIQVATPTAESIGQAELAVSRVSGVTSALTTSPAVGGTSLMRVTYGGDVNALAAALRGQGWNAQIVGGNVLVISR